MRYALALGLAAIGCKDPYNDGLPWFECADNAECMTVDVPVGSGTYPLFVARVRATGDRIGPLVMNYGGPGASASARILSFAENYPELTESFDLVAIDPRGTGQSVFSECVGEYEVLMDTEFDALDEVGFPIQRAARAHWLGSCRDDGGDLADHMGTMETVEDFEHVRTLLGDEPFTFVGFSWGTVLGQLYAETYPDSLRAIYLDGVAIPGGTYQDFVSTQVDGFQASFEDWSAWCAGDAECALDDPTAAVTDLFDDLRKEPANVEGDRDLTYARAWNGVIPPLYAEPYWPFLGQAVSEAVDGEPENLMALSDGFTGRFEDGNYAPGLAVYFLTECHDLALPDDDAAVIAGAEQAMERSPLFGAGLLLEPLTCMAAGAANDPLPEFVSASSAVPILLVGGENDPATPFANAVAVHEALDDSTLLAWTGNGHVAFGDSRCVTEAAFDYLIELEMPAVGRCD